VHYPQWNPTAADYLKPKYFYIPFLGCDVHSSRMARLVPAPQAGYWGTMMTMGWGVSDIVGWIESVYNYTNVMQAIPTMIQQMSILARTFNVDGPMAMEGGYMLDQLANENTIRTRESSVLNPIQLDVIGEIKAIQRNFQEVPELTRLIRQDLTAKAGLKEESLFSVEKSGLSGGSDSSMSEWSRQEETNRRLYAKLGEQLKPIAMLQVINALGLDNDILRVLDQTTITFDEQKIVAVGERTSVLASVTKGYFDIVAAGMPLDDAAKAVEQMSGGLFELDSELQEHLKERQEILDKRADEEHNINMKNALSGSAPSKPSITTSAGESSSGHSYGKKGDGDPSGVVKQKASERVSHSGSGTKKQGLAKAQSKVNK
jgi:hypothetical protein